MRNVECPELRIVDFGLRTKKLTKRTTGNTGNTARPDRNQSVIGHQLSAIDADSFKRRFG
jgi:hypothetical protein